VGGGGREREGEEERRKMKTVGKDISDLRLIARDIFLLNSKIFFIHLLWKQIRDLKNVLSLLHKTI
jgi:hypothetical protein